MEAKKEKYPALLTFEEAEKIYTALAVLDIHEPAKFYSAIGKNEGLVAAVRDDVISGHQRSMRKEDILSFILKEIYPAHRGFRFKS